LIFWVNFKILILPRKKKSSAPPLSLSVFDLTSEMIPCSRAVRSFATKASKSAATTNAAGVVPGANGLFRVTLFQGDGIGPEIAAAVKTIFSVS
jgi:hypothetical protein